MINILKRLSKVIFYKKILLPEILPLLGLDILISRISLGSLIQSPGGMQFIKHNSFLSLGLLKIVPKILEQFSVCNRDLCFKEDTPT